MVSQLDAVENFLRDEKVKNPMWHRDLELQVLVSAAGGERVEGEFKGKSYHSYTDGVNTWKSLRIPRNANTDPEYTDTNMSYDISSFAEGIGSTGWNWVTKKSEFFGYDFDSLVGHKVGLTAKELDEVVERAKQIPWVKLVRSKGGRGIHIFIQLDPFMKAENHNEHAANARMVLNYLCAKTRYDFKEKVDCLGGIMWVWHRDAKNIISAKLESGKYGSIDDLYQGEDFLPFKTLHEAKEPLTKVPGEFKEQLKIINGRAKRSKESNGELNMLTSTQKHVGLTDRHGDLFDWLDNNGKVCIWDADNNMLLCHTADLKEAHDALGMDGIFETNSTGSESGRDQNCFGFPTPGGSWVFRRHGRNTLEHPYWDKDSGGWTRAFFNKKPSISAVMRTYGGLLGPSGDFGFNLASQLTPVLAALGLSVDIPELLNNRTCCVKAIKGKFLSINIARSKEEDGNRSYPEWRIDKKWWNKVVNFLQDDDDTDAPDDIVRDVVSQGKQQGWFYKTETMGWVDQPRTNIEIALKAHNYTKPEIELIIGKCLHKPWEIVSRPFEPEYLGNRLWNKDAAQLAYRPQRSFTGTPTWDRILKHTGQNLDKAVAANEWCVANNVKTGYDWLKLWVACLIQRPTEPLPYLFLYSKTQETGKSTFHEALFRLFLGGKGCVRADYAIVSSGGFNGELAKAVFCVVEETDLNQSKLTLERIKDWVTSERITIHKKGKEPYSVPNTTHWVQCANNPRYVPVTEGDTRITMIHINRIKNQLMRGTMHDLLETEAPAFLFDLLAIEIPKHDGRLGIPCLETSDKNMLATEASESTLDLFIKENLKPVKGQVINWSDFVRKFQGTLGIKEKAGWSSIKIAKEMPTEILRGKYGDKRVMHIGNYAWSDKAPVGVELRVSSSGNLIPV